MDFGIVEYLVEYLKVGGVVVVGRIGVVFFWFVGWIFFGFFGNFVEDELYGVLSGIFKDKYDVLDMVLEVGVVEEYFLLEFC